MYHFVHKRICVFCGSSNKVDPKYFEAAKTLGRVLAQNSLALVYGGGGAGLMGAVADATKKHGGKVYGIIPSFMMEKEWGHQGIDELLQVEDMRQRKKKMIEDVDAIIALPGGCGTLEELLEVMTLKQLGLITVPILLVNIDGFYDPLLKQFENCIDEIFMRPMHRRVWHVCTNTENIIQDINNAPQWKNEDGKLAAI